MANINAPKGLVPVGHLTGSPWNGQFHKVFVPSSDATAIFIGDLVQYTGASAVEGTVRFGEDVQGVPQVTRSTAVSAASAGVVVGKKVNPDNLMNKHRLASTDAILYIVNDPTVVFEIQEDALVTPVAAASVGLNASLIYTAGNTATGVSGLVLDSDSVATTAGLAVKILGLTKRVGNNFNSGGAGTDQAVFDVMINAPLATTAGIVGV